MAELAACTAAAEATLALTERGYKPSAPRSGLAVRRRVRRASQHFPSAIRTGTGTVAFVGERSGHWAQRWGRPDIEVVVQWDDATVSTLADYHLVVIH